MRIKPRFIHGLYPNWLVLSLCVLLAVFSSHANAALVPSPPAMKARAWLLVDYNSNRVLAEHNSMQRVEPASLTKMMSAYVVLQEVRNGSIKLDDKVLISEKAWRMKGSKMFVRVDTRVSVNDLLRGMIVQSGNDASVALAEHVAGSEDAFAQLMNIQAQHLGMQGTHFTNSTGWPARNHYTTAHDLAILARAVIRDYPEHYAWYRDKEYTYNNIHQNNRNRLLWLDDRVDGIKTGHTDSAGYCLVASAVQDKMRLISVVLGASSDSSRSSNSRKLLNYGFRFYETFLLHKANEPLTNMRIWKGADETLSLGVKEDLFITLPRGQRGKIKANMTVETQLMAPANKGQQYGSVNIMLADKQIMDRPLVALQDVEEGGMWRKLVDNVKLMFQ